jgi:putative membrane-bound dehydrogenase-like protein
MRLPVAGLVAVVCYLAACFSHSVAAKGSPLPTPPEGWTLEVVAAAPAVRHPSVVCCAPDGRVFVAEDPMDISLPSADAVAGRVLCVHPGGRITVFADQLHAVFGMQYLDGKLYVLHNPKLTVFTDDDSGVASGRRDLIESTNPNPWALNWNDHVPANFKLAIDGFFYLAVGDKGLFGAVGADGKRVDMRGGGVVRFRPDGSGLEVFSTGVRNILDVAINDEDEIFTYDNTDEHDWMGRLTHMVDGGFYGYPYDFVPRRPYTLWMMADYGAGAATGTLCYNDDALPAEYRGNLFLADFGKRNVLRVRIARGGATYKAVSRQDLFADVPPDFRPVGMAFTPDGLGIYICDWQHVDTKETVEVGRLLKLTYVGTGAGAATPKPAWYVAAAKGKPFEASTGALVDALSHGAYSVRTVAQRRLAERGAGAAPALVALLGNPGAPPVARRHALWAFDAIDAGATNVELSVKLASRELNADAALRRQAIRQLGTRRTGAAAARALADMLRDGDTSIRFHAATSIGRVGDAAAAPALIAALREPDDWAWHAVFTALNRIGRGHPEVWEQVAAGLRSPDGRVRQGCAFAMRETFDPRIVEAVAPVARDRGASPAARAAAVSVLGPLHHKLPEWKGEWWAYHPALAPPPRKTVAWEGTPTVLAALRAALADEDVSVIEAALDALQDAADRDAADPIRRLITSGAPELTKRALPALATCDDGESVLFLTDLLNRRERDEGIAARVLDALGRMKAADAIPVMTGYANSPSPNLRRAAFDALVRVGGDPASGAIADLMDAHNAADVRRAAVAAAGESGDRSLVPKLLTAYSDRQTRDAAVAALARMPDARAAGAYLEGLTSSDYARKERCRTALREVRDAALPAVEAAEKSLSDEVVLELRQVYQDHDKAKRGPLFARPIAQKHPDEYLNFAMDHAGDARTGEKLFAASTAGGIGCATCHTVNGAGGTVGPDLSGVGAKYSRRDLAEAVLYPSKAVREGYQQVVVRTRAGQTYAGPVKAETAEELTLQESDGTLRRVRKDDVQARKDTGLSPMPEGLHAGLSPQQFADLVSYLESLKASEKSP